MRRPRPFYALALLLALLSGAQAAGPTGEDLAHVAHAHAHRPVWVSDDGAWRLSLTPRGELLREAQQAGAPAQRFQLPAGVRALASHGSGLQAWALHESGCLLRVDFGTAAPKRMALPWSPCAAQAEGSGEALPVYTPGALAVSADGQWLAHSGESGSTQVSVLNPRSGKTLRVLELAHPPLALRFEDGGARLAALTLQRGEQWEDIAGPSSLQWSRWDLQSGALWNEAQRDGGFQEPEGYLQAASAVRQFWLNRQGALEALELQCPVRRQTWALPELAGVQSLAADPLGRWVAVLEARPEAKAKVQRLLWLDASNGRLVHSARLPIEGGVEAVALQGHAQGLLLRRGLRVPREGTQYDHSPWRLQPWQNLSVPVDLAALPARSAAAASLCREPQEAAQARELERVAAPAEPLWRLQLQTWSEAQPKRCRGTDWPETRHPDRAPRRWGLSPAGQLWLDQGQQIHQLDPASGQVLARWPTPRQLGLCSTPSFARAQFLSWQGDTLSLRPFAEQLDSQARSTVERRPGWQLETAVWLGDRVLARWLKADRAELRLYRAAAQGGWTLVKARSGALREGASWIEEDDGNTSAVGWHELMPDAAAIAELEREERGVRGAGPRWQASRYQSVRAEDAGRLLLWDGVSGRPAGTGRVIDLGGGRAVLLEGVHLHHYRLRDAAQAALKWRRQGVPDQDSRWSDAWWWEAAQLLLMEREGGELLALR
ncbi:MAG: hypothetical protein U1E77_13600 [Inhella sp.]